MDLDPIFGFKPFNIILRDLDYHVHFPGLKGDNPGSGFRNYLKSDLIKKRFFSPVCLVSCEHHFLVFFLRFKHKRPGTYGFNKVPFGVNAAGSHYRPGYMSQVIRQWHGFCQDKFHGILVNGFHALYRL